MDNVRVDGGWIISEQPGGAEQRVPLRDLAMVEMVEAVELDIDVPGAWVVRIWLRGDGERDDRAWLVADADEASQLVEDIAQGHDTALGPMTPLDMLRLLVLEDLDMLLAGGFTSYHRQAG